MVILIFIGIMILFMELFIIDKNNLGNFSHDFLAGFLGWFFILIGYGIILFIFA